MGKRKRKSKYPKAGTPQVFELPPELCGDPDQPTRIHWTAPTLQTRREHESMRSASLVGDGPEFSRYMDKVIEDLVTAVENYEDDEGNEVTDADGFIMHGEPGVVSAFVEHQRKNSAVDEEEKKDSRPPSGSSSTPTGHGTDGTTQAAPESALN